MAHFYASVNGSRETIATKTGTKKSGMSAHVRGWNVGVDVRLSHVNGKDVVQVYKTSGSNGNTIGSLIAEYTEEVQS